jgi:hypothetical protein
MPLNRPPAMHILYLSLYRHVGERTEGFGWGRRKEAMARTKANPPAKVDKRYIICPWCGEKVQYLRRRGHSCFKFHLSEIERNVQQMNRD